MIRHAIKTVFYIFTAGTILTSCYTQLALRRGEERPARYHSDNRPDIVFVQTPVATPPPDVVVGPIVGNPPKPTAKPARPVHEGNAVQTGKDKSKRHPLGTGKRPHKSKHIYSGSSRENGKTLSGRHKRRR